MEIVKKPKRGSQESGENVEVRSSRTEARSQRWEAICEPEARIRKWKLHRSASAFLIKYTYWFFFFFWSSLAAISKSSFSAFEFFGRLNSNTRLASFLFFLFSLVKLSLILFSSLVGFVLASNLVPLEVALIFKSPGQILTVLLEDDLTSLGFDTSAFSSCK